MARLREITRDPVKLGFATFTLAVAVQAFHQIEHLAQIIQKNELEWQTFPGLLGNAFDFEAVHLLYNTALFLTVLAVWVVFFKNPGIWRQSRIGHLALSFAVVFQGYHLLEHLVRAVQYVQDISAGIPAAQSKPPGIVGQVVPAIELHFWINSVIIGALIVAYLAFRPAPAAPAPAELGA